MEKIRLTAPDGTKTRISRCTDQQVLPVDILKHEDFISFSVLTAINMRHLEEVWDRVGNGVVGWADDFDRAKKGEVEG